MEGQRIQPESEINHIQDECVQEVYPKTMLGYPSENIFQLVSTFDIVLEKRINSNRLHEYIERKIAVKVSKGCLQIGGKICGVCDC